MTEICPRFTPGPWKFNGECKWDAREDRCCAYCGSLHPDLVMARLEASDIELGSTDKSYKVYVRNAGGAPFKQTYRDCPRDSTCKGPDDCTHWVTRDMDSHKFYFMHLSNDQMTRFVELYNAKRIKFEGGMGFYVMPYFCRRA
ncbi:MAG: hypothetical protein KGL39_36275 [Patescibacteria group bacterium]|nr:hypothetical protein [Patescibacteria group bacterium]